MSRAIHPFLTRQADGNLGADLRVLSRDIVASLQDPAIRTAFASIVAAAVPDLAARDMLARFTTGEPLGQDVADRAAAIAAARTGVLAAELPGLPGDDPGDPAGRMNP